MDLCVSQSKVAWQSVLGSEHALPHLGRAATPACLRSIPSCTDMSALRRSGVDGKVVSPPAFSLSRGEGRLRRTFSKLAGAAPSHTGMHHPHDHVFDMYSECLSVRPAALQRA